MTKPIRRFFRLVTSILCLLSLLGCMAAGWLWWRSDRTDQDPFNFRTSDARYTLRSGGGRLVLSGPPRPPASPRVRRSVGKAVSALRNDQLWWRGRFGVFIRMDSPAFDLWMEQRSVPAAADCALLAALHEPDKALAAHVLLHWRSRPTWIWEAPADQAWAWHYRKTPDDSGAGRSTYDGVDVELQPWRGQSGPLPPSQEASFEARWNPAQLTTVRGEWHRRLDVTVWTVPLQWAACVTSLPPLLWSGVRLRRAWVWRRRRRMGQCLRCGYDLRGSGGRCSECGEATGRSGAA